MTEQAHPSADLHDDRLEFETLISDLSSRFINLSPGEVDREINDAMRRVGELLGIDLAVLWRWSSDVPRVITPTNTYRARGGLQPPEPSIEQQYPWSIQQMLAGRMIAVSSLEELPAEAAVDREFARVSGIKSNLTLPLAVGGEPPVGALAFNTLHEHRDWPDGLVKRLQLVAHIFTNALARKRHELSLQESEERLAAAADLVGLAFYEMNFSGGAGYVDDRFRQVCGLPPERQEGRQALEFWIEHLHPEDRPWVLHLRQQLHDGTLGELSLEYRFLNPVAGLMWIQHLARVATRDDTGRALVTFGVLRDITEHKRAEDELSDLSRRLIQAHEEERALLARELHDDVTQRLAVLAIEAGRAELAAPDGAQSGAMRLVREGLTRLSEDVHSLAYQLHPSVLEELGLVEALRAECERRGRQGRVQVSVELDPLPAVVAKDTALCLFRVAQEALNNVTRHAGARTASLALRHVDGGLLLAVRDDGVGFDPASPARGRSLGLAGMRERLRLVNGSLDIESAPGQGTEIVAWVPAEGGVE